VLIFSEEKGNGPYEIKLILNLSLKACLDIISIEFEFGTSADLTESKISKNLAVPSSVVGKL
jgi:hypothetical protein